MLKLRYIIGICIILFVLFLLGYVVYTWNVIKQVNALKKIKRKKIVRYPRAQEQLCEYKKSLKKQSVDYLFSKKELICFYIFWLLLFGVSVVYALIRCKLSYIRLGQSVLDIGTSFVYYFTLIVPFEFDASVISIPDIPIENLLPVTFVEKK